MEERKVQNKRNLFLLYDLSHLLHIQKDFPYDKFLCLVAGEQYTLPKNPQNKNKNSQQFKYNSYKK